MTHDDSCTDAASSRYEHGQASACLQSDISCRELLRDEQARLPVYDPVHFKHSRGRVPSCDLSSSYEPSSSGMIAGAAPDSLLGRRRGRSRSVRTIQSSRVRYVSVGPLSSGEYGMLQLGGGTHLYDISGSFRDESAAPSAGSSLDDDEPEPLNRTGWFVEAVDAERDLVMCSGISASAFSCTSGVDAPRMPLVEDGVALVKAKRSFTLATAMPTALNKQFSLGDSLFYKPACALTGSLDTACYRHSEQSPCVVTSPAFDLRAQPWDRDLWSFRRSLGDVLSVSSLVRLRMPGVENMYIRPQLRSCELVVLVHVYICV